MAKPMLFQPYTLRNVTLPNRVVISPMATYSAIDGQANDWHLAHLGQFALGGPGTVMVEATAVTETGRITNGDVGLWNDAQIAPLRRIADLMRSLGVVPSIQLAHSGRKGSMQRPWQGNGPLSAADVARGDKIWQPIGPMAEPMDEGWPVPQAMSAADIKDIVQAWVDATKRAGDAGFEIVEIHNAHGYLVHQFLSPLSNRRDDAYGGDLNGRMRFPLELAEAIRNAWPKDKPLFLRISAVDGVDHGWSMDDTVIYAKALKERGIDLIDCSSGGLRGSATAARVKRSYGYQAPYAERVRREAKIPSMAVGLIIDPHFAEDILQKGQADLIAIGREALANPRWPQMAELALGRPMMDALDDWPEQYGWWMKHRERSLNEIRQAEADEAEASQS